MRWPNRNAERLEVEAMPFESEAEIGYAALVRCMEAEREMIALLKQDFPMAIAKARAPLKEIEAQLSTGQTPSWMTLEDYEELYMESLTDCVLFARYADMSAEIPMLEEHLRFYMEHWQSRPTRTAVMPEVVDNLSDRALAGEYLWRMLGTSDTVDPGWFPINSEWIWLQEQASRFADHPVALQIEAMSAMRPYYN